MSVAYLRRGEPAVGVALWDDPLDDHYGAGDVLPLRVRQKSVGVHLDVDGPSLDVRRLPAPRRRFARRLAIDRVLPVLHTAYSENKFIGNCYGKMFVTWIKYTHTQTHTHTNTQAHIRTIIQAHTCTKIHTQTHANTHARTQRRQKQFDIGTAKSWVTTSIRGPEVSLQTHCSTPVSDFPHFPFKVTYYLYIMHPF